MGERLATIGVEPCGCVTFVTIGHIDDPDSQEEIIEVVRRGGSIEHVPVEEARRRLVLKWPCEHVSGESATSAPREGEA